MPRITWNGTAIDAEESDSIAAALTAAGETRLGARRSGAPRGAFCGMGVCQDCLVTIDGVRSRRACMVKVTEGMKIEAQPAVTGRAAALSTPETEPRPEEADLVIVGAGPAGLQAAITAREGGLSALVLDERGETGGQFFKPRSCGYRGTHPPDHQHQRGSTLRQRAEESGARILTGQAVWYARSGEGGFELRTEGEVSTGGATISARAVVLATGAAERPALIPGWTRPGVMTIGAAQTLVRRYGVVPPGRIAIAGHGPLGLQLAAELLRAGADVIAIAERGQMRSPTGFARMLSADLGLVRDGFGYLLRARAAGVPVLTGWEAVEVMGDAERVTGIRLVRLDGGAERALEADTVCLGDGFAPQVELARLLGVPVGFDPETGIAVPERADDGATPVPGIWIAGDSGGIGGARLAEHQGRLAAAGALEWLGRPAPDTTQTRAALRRDVRFQKGLWQVFAAPPRALPLPGTTLCRCEEVTAADIARAIEHGARDLGALKRATRLGMGPCQGRYCVAPAARFLATAGHPPRAEALFAPQLPARPVPLAAISREKPEWGGHRESTPGRRPGTPPKTPIARPEADLVVIGAGVTGISAALFAAKAGADVLCIDRGRINGEASGGNAGSLHLQLLSWDFGDKAVAGGSPQLRTLPLQKESIALWKTLEEETGTDFEMRVTGGLMVAENPDQIAFLEKKCEAEARMGIATEVIGAERIRQIVPGISKGVVAGAWCAGEGKINPLAATAALAQAAQAAGVRIEEQTEVSGIAPDGEGYLIDTPRGRIKARRLVIAAGGWSAELGRYLGTDIPVRGAPLQMIVTEPGPPLVPCLIAHADRHLTMKQTDAGTVLIGGAWPAETGPSGQPLVLAESLEGNAWVATHTLPALGALRAIRSWAAMNIDIDGAPLLARLPGHPGVAVAATANGYTLGPLMGREAAEIALHGRVRQDLGPFSFDRFT